MIKWQAAMNKQSHQTGFTLIEVLITIIVLSLSALGAAGLQVKAQQFSHNAYLNTQAILLAHDMSERMRANAAGTQTRKYHLPAARYHAGCFSLAGCDASEMAESDMYQWAGDHQNSSIRSLPQGSAAVCIDSTPDDGTPTSVACDGVGETYAIKVWWRTMDGEITRAVITSTFNS